MPPVQTNAQPPLEPKPPRLGAPSTAAAGLTGVAKAAQFAIGNGGLAAGVKSLLKVNQHDGFDCQSCAWPSPDGQRHTFEFCENGAKAVADEITTARADAAFFARYCVAELSRQSDWWLNQQGRLVEPLVLRPGATHYESIGWDEAADLVAAELAALPSPDAAAFYTSGRTSNEAAFLWQLFARQFGTNNLPDCSNLCHESSGYALSTTLGVGKGTVTLDDFAASDLILLFGQNPGTNHPRMLSTLEQAKARGARIVVVNPLAEVGTVRFKNPQHFLDPLKALPTLAGRGSPLCDLHVPVRIGGDAAFLKGVMKCLLAAEERQTGSAFDHAFLEVHTTGSAELIASLRLVPWDDIEQGSGVPRSLIEQAADLVRKSSATISCWAMGLTQHRHAVATIQEVVNLHLLRGMVGRPGAGLCPVRGHSNVQGDRTMGITPRPKADFIERLGAEFNFTPPTAPGLDTVDTIRALRDGRVKVLLALGGNFLSACPDTEATAEALRRASLTLHVATKLNRSHLVTGRTALLLPCLGRTEVDRQAMGPQYVTVEDSMGIINRSCGHLEPAHYRLESEVAIVSMLAETTLGARGTVPWRNMRADYTRIRESIGRVVPGCEGFAERAKAGMFYLPHAVREGRFATRDGKAHCTTHPLPPPLGEAGYYVLMTIRTHDQFNTTVYGLDDRYRGIYGGRRVVLMHPADLRAEGLEAGQFVDLTSHFQGETRQAPHFMVAPYDIPRGCAASYFPEANVLVPLDSTAVGSNTPTSKAVLITVRASRDEALALRRLRDDLQPTPLPV